MKILTGMSLTFEWVSDNVENRLSSCRFVGLGCLLCLTLRRSGGLSVNGGRQKSHAECRLLRGDVEDSTQSAVFGIFHHNYGVYMLTRIPYDM